MNNYQSLHRRGVRSVTSQNPKVILEDIDERIRTLSPNATPLITLGNLIGRGKPPQSKKIQVMQSYEFDNYDYCSSVYMGTGADLRFARMTLDQPSRPDLTSVMFYHPQDKFYIAKTGQVVEVVMTPDASMLVGGSETSLAVLLTGNTATRSASGTVVVRNIEANALTPFTTSDVIFLGRTIYESQDIEAQPKMHDVIFDCNFVEHKEDVIIFTEDQKNIIKNYGVPDWTRQQKDLLQRFKVDIEYNALFSERSADFTEPQYPKYHMRGLIKGIKTNVSYYNPAALTDFELLFSNFLFEQAFRWNEDGTMSKIALCGGRFLQDFNMAFREYRRTSNLTDIGKKIGLNADTYMIPGGFEVTLMRSEAFRLNTGLENWCCVIDPSLAEWRIVKDFNTKMYQNNNERKLKLMVEWQGTIAWHMEQHHALLRTA